MRKRPDGLWEQTMMIGYTPEGKRKRKSFYGKTQRELKEKVEQFKLQQSMGLTAEADLSFGEWAEQWYKNYKDQISAVTYESYRYTLVMLNAEFGRRKLKSIKPLDVENFLRNVQQEKSESAMTKCRGMMYQILHKAEANDLIIKNPVRFADRVRKKNAAPSKKDAFTREEVALLFQHLPKDQIGHTIRLMIGTGLRTQEVLCLEQQHIAQDGSTIHVRQAVENIKGKTVLNPEHTKSQKSKRDIPVPEFVQESALYLREQANPYTWDGKEPGTVFNAKAFRTRYTKAIEAVPGVRPLTPHCCRHTYVTLLQSLNVSMEVISGLAGHSSTTTTREYLHIQPETARLVSEMYSRELAELKG